MHHRQVHFGSLRNQQTNLVQIRFIRYQIGQLSLKTGLSGVHDGRESKWPLSVCEFIWSGKKKSMKRNLVSKL